MSRLIVHIGTHKTATTSLQRHLARNLEALAARDIWYPDYGLIGRGSHYAPLGIVNALAGQHETFGIADAWAFFRAVTARVQDHFPGPLFCPNFPEGLRFGDALHPLFLNMLLQVLKPNPATNSSASPAEASPSQ